MYALLLPYNDAATYGIYRRVKLWRAMENRFDRPRWGVAHLVLYALLQASTWRRIYPGSFHAMIYWGFIVLAIATAVVMIDYDFGIPIMRGQFTVLSVVVCRRDGAVGRCGCAL